MEPRQDQPTTASAQTQGSVKKGRFQLVKLEERITPSFGGGPSGDGCTWGCTYLCTQHGHHGHSA
jgi:hypothetical protein